MWIISRISNKEKLHVLISKPEPAQKRVEQIVLKNFGGVIKDYMLYKGTDEESERVQNGDKYSLTWELDTVTGLDFSVEDAMYQLVVDTNESDDHLVADDIVPYEIRFRMMKADLSGVTNFNGKKVVPINTPKGKNFIEVLFSNGSATVQFSTNIGGNWAFPGFIGVFEDYKLSSAVQIKAISTDII